MVYGVIINLSDLKMLTDMMANIMYLMTLDFIQKNITQVIHKAKALFYLYINLGFKINNSLTIELKH